MGLLNKRYFYRLPSVGDIVRVTNRRIEEIEQDTVHDEMRKYRNADINEIREVYKSDPDFIELHCLLGRQRLYGYIDYRDGYVIGKSKDGDLFKINIELYKAQHPFEKLEEPVDKIVKTAVYGSHFQNLKMYKLTYDEQNKENFSIHTDWVDYQPESFVYDANMYCGLHFTTLSSVLDTFDDLHTIYGHKLVVLSFPEELHSEIYYNYQSDYWCGDKVYVETIMDLSERRTWDYIMSVLEFKETEEIRGFLDNSIKYLHRLKSDAGLSYGDAILYLETRKNIS